MRLPPSGLLPFGSAAAAVLPASLSRLSLSLSRYRVTLRALETLDLPAYLGSTPRGAFGHAFRRVACLAPTGGPCPTADSCPYHLVFETALRHRRARARRGVFRAARRSALA